MTCHFIDLLSALQLILVGLPGQLCLHPYRDSSEHVPYVFAKFLLGFLSQPVLIKLVLIKADLMSYKPAKQQPKRVLCRFLSNTLITHFFLLLFKTLSRLLVSPLKQMSFSFMA